MDVFEEVFKLIFTKLYDEMACYRGTYKPCETLLHGELQSHGQPFEAYEPAYRIVMRFLDALRT